LLKPRFEILAVLPSTGTLNAGRH